MCNRSSSKNYNALTLQPATQEDRDNFWMFRCRDISSMFNILLILLLVETFTYVARVVNDVERHTVS